MHAHAPFCHVLVAVAPCPRRSPGCPMISGSIARTWCATYSAYCKGEQRGVCSDVSHTTVIGVPCLLGPCRGARLRMHMAPCTFPTCCQGVSCPHRVAVLIVGCALQQHTQEENQVNKTGWLAHASCCQTLCKAAPATMSWPPAQPSHDHSLPCTFCSFPSQLTAAWSWSPSSSIIWSAPSAAAAAAAAAGMGAG